METMEQRIIACARGWLGTRFHHQGRLKKTAGHNGGVDCLGLLTGIARELDLHDAHGVPLASLDKTDYGHLPDGHALHEGLSRALIPVPLADIQPGCILLIALEEVPRHLAIATDYPPGTGMIHAYAQARKVVEHTLDGWWRERVWACFRVPGTSL